MFLEAKKEKKIRKKKQNLYKTLKYTKLKILIIILNNNEYYCLFNCISSYKARKETQIHIHIYKYKPTLR